MVGKKIKPAVVVLIALTVLAGCAVYIMAALNNIGTISFERMFKVKYPLSFSMGDYGTAVKPEGKTICVSLFVDVRSSSWNEEDHYKKDKCLEQLITATDWITEKAACYGKNVEYICNWKQYSDLYFEVPNIKSDYGFHLRENDGYNRLWDYINNNVPSEELLAKYNAENIIYMTYYSVAVESIPAFSMDCYFDENYSYDTVYLPTAYTYMEISATVVAHEILHLYGAPDWYKALTEGIMTYNVTEETVQYMIDNYPNDIMLRTFDSETGKAFEGGVNGEISDLTAYYIGLIEETPQQVYDLGLDLSQHDPRRVPYCN